jgi:hypothetical protein
MRASFILLFSLSLTTLFGQTINSCDTIYNFPNTLAKYKDGEIGLLKYLSGKLPPILSDCVKHDEELIGSLRISLIIDASGKIIQVDFPKLQATKSCKEKLADELLKMEGWTAAKINDKFVCSKFYVPIKCIKWQ